MKHGFFLTSIDNPDKILLVATTGKINNSSLNHPTGPQGHSFSSLKTFISSAHQNSSLPSILHRKKILEQNACGEVFEKRAPECHSHILTLSQSLQGIVYYLFHILGTQ